MEFHIAHAGRIWPADHVPKPRDALSEVPLKERPRGVGPEEHDHARACQLDLRFEPREAIRDLLGVGMAPLAVCVEREAADQVGRVRVLPLAVGPDRVAELREEPIEVFARDPHTAPRLQVRPARQPLRAGPDRLADEHHVRAAEAGRKRALDPLWVRPHAAAVDSEAAVTRVDPRVEVGQLAHLEPH
jgi:hypothetical protein